MMRQRFLGLLIVALQAPLVAYMFDRRLFPAVAILFALAGVGGRVRVGLTRNAQAGVALLLALIVVAEWRLILVGQEIPTVLFLGSLGYPFAQYFLTLQVLAFFLRTEDGRLPMLFPIFSAFVMAYAGDIVTIGYQTPFYQVSTLCYLVLLGLFLLNSRAPSGGSPARPARGARAAAQGAVLCGALCIAFPAGLFLSTYGKQIDNAFVGILFGIVQPPTLGFSTHARLGSVARLKERGGADTALRVYSETTPGYLRGRAFDTYADAEWQVTGQERPLRLAGASAPGLPTPRHGRRIFPLDQQTAPTWHGINVRPRIDSGGFLFTSLESAAVAVQEGGVTADDNRNLKLLGGLPRTGYEAFQPLAAQTPGPPLSDEMRRRLTAVPGDLDPRVRELARRLFEGRHLPTAKILAVVNYFLANYAYELSIRVPDGVDPVTYFLLEQANAYCEYFASGAAMLLRLGGVPCRYVTGFVAAEHNPVGGYWIARNKDAHAWVEAYDDAESRWVVVEPTVAAGVPRPDREAGRQVLAHLWDAAKYMVQQLRDAYRSGGWRDLVLAAAQGAYAGFLRLVTSLPGLLLLAGLVALGLYRGRRRRARRPKPRPLSQDVAALNKLLRRADRHMKRRGLIRPPHETLHQFAARIRAEDADGDHAQRATAWYLAYAHARYQQRILPDAADQLRQDIPA